MAKVAVSGCVRLVSAWSTGRRRAGRGIHGRIADGVRARRAVGTTAGFPTDGHGPRPADGSRTWPICWLRRSSWPWMQWL